MTAEPAIRPSAKVAQESLVPPVVLAEIATPVAHVQILEWLWPEVFESTSVEHDLMLEMSLPPMAGMATATFPTIAPGTTYPFGVLFLRYPGIAIRTHAEGGQVRLLRCTFAKANKRALIGDRHAPSLALLQRLINLRSDALRSQMRLLLRELENPQPGSPAAAEALVNLIEIELKRLFDQDFEPKAGGRLAPWQFRRLRERLEAGGERPSVPELAALCGISVRHLHRQFLNLTGVTISDYVEGQIVSRAKTMLSASAQPIRQIARDTGFEHANSFSRTFRRRTGMTPQQYRQLKSGGGTTGTGDTGGI
jgi:AraC family transcriptional regulator